MTEDNKTPSRDERLLERISDLEAALKGLLENWASFEASTGNMEEAYYKLAKYARPQWDEARAVLSSGDSKE